MICKTIDLELDYEGMGLEPPKKAPYLQAYVIENGAEYHPDRIRPAVLICPGGAYAFVSEREGDPIAMAFLAAGISVFVLHYTVYPDGHFPDALLQALRSIQIIRENAAEWKIDPDNISVCGFSAGGHLAASAGVFWNHEVVKQYGLGGESCRPNGMILSYPVITSGPYAHRDSFKNLLGSRYDELVDFVSLEGQVSSDTPRTFLWHTDEDDGVPVQNSLLLAAALKEKKIPLELHIYPHGVHGLSLSNDLVCEGEGIIPKVQTWIRFATEWVYGR